MDSKTQLVRVQSSGEETPMIDWSYQLENFDLMDPAFITTNPLDDSVLYLSGRYQGKSSVMKFKKSNGLIHWQVKFERITSIRAIIEVPNEEYFYGCGDFEFDQNSNLAVIFKMQDDGTILWMKEIGGDNPVSGQPQQDHCVGLSHDPSNGHVTALLQVKAESLRQSDFIFSGDFYDTVLYQFDASGDF